VGSAETLSSSAKPITAPRRVVPCPGAARLRGSSYLPTSPEVQRGPRPSSVASGGGRDGGKNHKGEDPYGVLRRNVAAAFRLRGTSVGVRCRNAQASPTRRREVSTRAGEGDSDAGGVHATNTARVRRGGGFRRPCVGGNQTLIVGWKPPPPIPRDFASEYGSGGASPQKRTRHGPPRDSMESYVGPRLGIALTKTRPHGRRCGAREPGGTARANRRSTCYPDLWSRPATGRHVDCGRVPRVRSHPRRQQSDTSTSTARSSSRWLGVSDAHDRIQVTHRDAGNSPPGRGRVGFCGCRVTGPLAGGCTCYPGPPIVLRRPEFAATRTGTC